MDIPRPSYSEVHDFEGIETIRQEKQIKDYAIEWISAQSRGDVTSDYHMNLMGWTEQFPALVLAIILELIDRADEDVSEMVAMGPVDWLVTHSGGDFTLILRETIKRHEGFALFTKWMRENSDLPEWSRLR